MATVVSAPGVVKLFGEHAVVFGRLSVAAAVSLYAKAVIEDNDEDGDAFGISLPDIGGKRLDLGRGALKALHDAYIYRRSLREFAEGSGIDHDILPYAAIASVLAHECGARPMGRLATITSGIPIRMGMASSAACATALAVALSKDSSLRLDDARAIDIARHGDRIAHRNEGAGKIDMSTSYYGGYVSYSDARGAERVRAKRRLELLLVDTGPKKPTSETVGLVAERHRTDRPAVELLLDRINGCSVRGLAALGDGDMEVVGAAMLENHELLRELGVSSGGLDSAVAISKSNGAYGAKLSGGGGGGLAIVLPRDTKRLAAVLKGAGFNTYVTSVSELGARDYLVSGHAGE